MCARSARTLMRILAAKLRRSVAPVPQLRAQDLFSGLALALISGCDRATPNATTYGRMSSRIVRLRSGDSVERQSTLQVAVPDGPSGRIAEFFPFIRLADTEALRAKAVALLDVVHPEFETSDVAFLALRAVELPVARRHGIYTIHNYAFVFERRSDGRWYALADTVPVRLNVSP